MSAAPRGTAPPHVLFVTYNGLLEPLGLRQGLAYMEPMRDEFRFTVLSFEKETRHAAPDRRRAMEERLADEGIRWIPLRYHRRPTVPATLFDVWAGGRALARLRSEDPIALVHARGYVPAMIGRRAKERFGIPLLFDIRGLLADEYVDGGVWQAGSLPERLTRAAERRLLAAADGIVTLTEAIRPEVEGRLRRSGREGPLPPWRVIPCCVDLAEFRPDPAARARARERLRIGGDPLLVYSGSVGTWYPAAALVEVFAGVRERRPGAGLLLVLNGSDAEIRRVAAERGIPEGAIHTVRAAPDEVPAHLAAGDAGIALIQPSPSKRASSPTKVAEYLACGLPVLVNAGVGDHATFAGERAVVVAGGLDRSSLAEAAAVLLDRLADAGGRREGRGDATLGEAARELAGRRFDLVGVGARRYRELYGEILGRDIPGPQIPGREASR